MRETILTHALVVGAVLLTSCSERTEDSAKTTVDAVAADAEANAEAVADTVEKAAGKAAAAVDRTAAKADRASERAEADAQGETVSDAAVN